MKKIYRLLLLFSVLSVFYLAQKVLENHIKNSLPDVQVYIEVVEWNQNRSTDSVFSDLDQYAEENNLQFHRVMTEIDSKGETSKNVYTFSKGVSNYSYHLPSLKENINFFDSKELMNTSPIGGYYSTQSVPKNIKSDFEKMGLHIQVETINIWYILSEYFFSVYGLIFFILWSITLLSYCFVVISNFKKIGLFEIHGRYPVLVGLYGFGTDVCLLSVIALFFGLYRWNLITYFIVCWGALLVFMIFYQSLLYGLFSFVGSIVEKLKNRRPYHKLLSINNLARLLLLVGLSIGFQFSFQEVQRFQKIEVNLQKWQTIGDYYQLLFNRDTTLLPQEFTEDEASQKLHSQQVNSLLLPLFKAAEQTGSILAGNNEDRKKAYSTGFYFDSHSLMIVNHNFLNKIPILDVEGNRIVDLDRSRFSILVPKNLEKDRDQILEILRYEIELNRDVYSDIPYDGDVQILYIDSNQEIFNFNVENLEQAFSYNPVILVVDLNLLAPGIDNLISELSQGNYLFSNIELAKGYIKDTGLGNQFVGFSSAQNSGLALLKEVRNNIILTLLMIVLMVFVLILIEYFICQTYIEIQRKKLFLNYILGKSWMNRHYMYLFKCLMLNMIAFIIFMYYGLKWQIAIIVFGVDISFLVGSLLFSENNQQLETLKKGI
ncbi:hypothetical protein [Streptococcus suis]|uniref:hypothetical protein n=1 Tax=Streptococcus suis TaxID=1307 RepID=UPI00211B9D20|nr:hypothetical protein [Streptococcus suis]MCQ9225742.1 hypothetical protein [Streptococcus suis]MCQ9227970.1 hypothetical protein [Streptococcus suis]MCQ9242073.1 hypothetical protein [Streptococcus suis]MCQ9274306.1 hypothetical protein [Streptococcus suis]MDE7534580.1 hypothetical protein [Streptococcus suis]